MGYFKAFPGVKYRGDGPSQLISAKDITVRARILDYIQNSQDAVVEYNISDGERPEHLAHRVYGRPDYHWIILLYNEIHDPFFEWPMSSVDLNRLVENKYAGRAYFVDMNLAADTFTSVWFEAGDATIDGLPVTITDWDPNLYKVVVDDTSPTSATVGDGSVLTQERSDGVTITATVKRVVDYNVYAPHHFENVDTLDVMDHHLVNSDPTTRKDLGEENVDTETSNVSYLQRYIRGADVIALDDKTIEPVTNFEYEIRANDAKRKIRVMRPEFADIVSKDLTKVFANG